MLALDYCHRLIDEGFEVLPIAPGTKQPTKGFEWRNPHSPEELHSILNVHPGGIGISCSDRFVCIDFDADADENFYKFISRVLQERPNLAYNCYVEKSPHGYHLVFHTKEAAKNGVKLAYRNGDSNKFDEKHQKKEQADKPVLLIETKGEGGYFVSYPTDGYFWIKIPVPDGSFLSTTPIWDLKPITPGDVEWLFNLGRSFDTYVGPAREKKQAVKPVSPERQAERNREQAREQKSGWISCEPMEYWGSGCSQERYEQLLEDYDWQKDGMDENGRIQYWRPGLERDPNNHSGNLYFDEEKNCWFLYLFSTLSELPGGSGLPAWQFLMYEEGYTNEPDPRNIDRDEKAEWCSAWYEEQAQHIKVFWEPVVDYLHLTQSQFNWRK